MGWNWVGEWEEWARKGVQAQWQILLLHPEPPMDLGGMTRVSLVLHLLKHRSRNEETYCHCLCLPRRREHMFSPHEEPSCDDRSRARIQRLPFQDWAVHILITEKVTVKPGTSDKNINPRLKNTALDKGCEGNAFNTGEGGGKVKALRPEQHDFLYLLLKVCEPFVLQLFELF